MRTIIIFTGVNNISDNKPVSATVKRYLAPPGATVEGKKIPASNQANVLRDIGNFQSIPSNLISSDVLRYVYDENSDIQCGVNPSNLVAPMKVNDNLVSSKTYRSSAFNNHTNPEVVDLSRALGSMNPIFFDPNTERQENRSMVPDLIYKSELDKVNSLHNAIAHPGGYLPPPIIQNPDDAMTSQAVTNTNYYPVSNNFFSRDQFSCYQSTMSLINKMNREKPAHLIEHDKRHIYNHNHFVNKPKGNPIEPFSPVQNQTSVSQNAQTSPNGQISQNNITKESSLSPPKYDVKVLKSKKSSKSDIQKTRQNIRLQQQKQDAIDQQQQQQYQSDESPDEDADEKQENLIIHQMPEFAKYQHYEATEEQCRKELPDKQFVMSSSDDDAENENKNKRVMFEDEKDTSQYNIDTKQIKKDMFSNSGDHYGSALKSSQLEDSGSDPNSPQQYERGPEYQHFHDESMSKLEAVLQRQRERLENMGGFSGKSSQMSKKTDGTEQNLEDAYKDLEKEINNIKKNLEASQNSQQEYSPLKFEESNNLRESINQNDYELSPSDMD